MTKYLIIYGSKEGQTAKIAQFMGDIIVQDGHEVDLYNAKTFPEHLSLEAYTGILVGSSVHMGHWSTPTRNFIRKFNTQLESIPSAFFSVSMSATSPDSMATTRLDHQVQKYLKPTGWQPKNKVHFAGCVAFTKYGFFTKTMMRAIAKSQNQSTDTSQDHEYTNWDNVTEFVKGFMEEAELAHHHEDN